MQTSNINDVLLGCILVGMLMSIATLIVAVVNGRSSHRAQAKATSNLRELYERTYRKTPFKSRRFISIARPGKVERRVAPSAEGVPEEPPAAAARDPAGSPRDGD
jgi:hypothetical protein